MVQRKRTYKKRAYKKRTYKRRYYKRRYYKRRYAKPIKKPEIHILEWNTPNYNTQSGTVEQPFNGSYGVGRFINMTPITSNTDADIDKIQYNINGKLIEGKKIRLKYLYIKGYIKVSSSSDADDFNCKLMLFRWKRNTPNKDIKWEDLINNTMGIDLDNPQNWSDLQRLDMLYKQDWKNDIKINFYKKVKNLYRKYDDANNIIPFRIRIPLYDCVLSCDCSKTSNNYTAYANPSTNGLYFTLLSNRYDENTFISYKYKLYYTDY